MKLQTKSLICVLLATGTLAVYWPVRHQDFVNYDDNDYVTDNIYVKRGLTLEGLRWAFTTNHASNWHPLTWLSHMLDVQLFGTNAGAHKLVNVALHMGATILLFLVLNRMTAAPWRSAFVAAVFALHPLRVESVAWVSERKDALCAFLWMLTIGAYVWYVERPQVRRCAPVTICFALALMAKPMAVTLPFVLLLLDVWPLGRTRWAVSPAGRKSVVLSFGRLVREKIPFFVLTALSCGVTYWAQQAGGAMTAAEALPLGVRLGNAAVSVVSYIGKTFWPVGLAPLYPYRRDLALWQVGVAAVVVVAVSLLVVKLRRAHPHVALGWFWYLGTLVPVLGVVQVGMQSMADRYTYIPHVGLFVLLAWSIPMRVLERRSGKIVAGTLAAVALIGSATLTRQQQSYWRDSVALFERTLQVTSGNFLAHNNLAIALYERGDVVRAMDHLREALAIAPKFAYAHNNLGLALAKQGQIEEAIGHYYEALRLDPKYPFAHNNLGIALAKSGRLEEATAHFREALRLKPTHAEAHKNFGNVLVNLNQIEQAKAHFAQAVRLNPDLAEAHRNLGAILGREGRLQAALPHLRRAVELAPDDPEAQNNLGYALSNLGRPEQAVPHLVAALRLKRDYPEAHNNLGFALAVQGRLSEAIEHFAEAIRLKPDHAEAHYNFATALAKQSRYVEARVHFEKALRLDPRLEVARAALELLDSKMAQ